MGIEIVLSTSARMVRVKCWIVYPLGAGLHMYIYIYTCMPIVFGFPLPTGSMYAIYGNIYHQYTPFMLALIYHTWILWVMGWMTRNHKNIRCFGSLLHLHAGDMLKH